MSSNTDLALQTATPDLEDARREASSSEREKASTDGDIAETMVTRTRTGTSTIVPRSKRSGLFASLTILPEIEDPKDYSPATKHFIVFIVACAAMSGPMSCGIMFPALPAIEEELHTSATVANLSVAIFLLGMGISPLWLAYISEHFGRRTVYLTTFLSYTMWTLLTGFSKTITQLLVFRFLAACSSGSAQALGAGTIADIFVTQERGTAMGIFYLGPLVGPLISPVLSGALTSAPGAWRNTQWFLTAFACFATLLLTFCLPETLRDPKVLTIMTEGRKKGGGGDGEQRTERPPTGLEVVVHTLVDPLKTFLFFRFPAVTCSVLYASLNFGCLYVMNVSIEYTFVHAPYNYSTVIVGCLYLGNSLGYVLGSILGGRWCDHVLKKSAAAAAAAATSPDGQTYVPERRIGVNAWTGAVMAPVGLLCYGWSIDRHLFWFVPLLFTFLFGLGTMFIYAAVTTYLVDALPGRSSSAMALNNFVRNVLACVGSLVAVAGIDALGPGILFTIIFALLCASTVLVALIVLRGDHWREQAKM